jgi:hypothetical protein
MPFDSLTPFSDVQKWTPFSNPNDGPSLSNGFDSMAARPDNFTMRPTQQQKQKSDDRDAIVKDVLNQIEATGASFIQVEMKGGKIALNINQQAFEDAVNNLIGTSNNIPTPPDSGSYVLVAVNGSVSWSNDIALTKLTIGATVVTDGNITIGDSVLTDGDLDLGGSGTFNAGESVTVGDSILTTGDLNLGDSGTIETDSVSATGDINCDTLEASDASVDSLEVSGDANIESDLNVSGNIDCASLSADSITYAGTDLDAYIDDSINNALNSLEGSGTLDCDSKEVTITFTT